ncbi:MAG: hypothetical protein Q9217_006372 [Psora testacea]
MDIETCREVARAYINHIKPYDTPSKGKVLCLEFPQGVDCSNLVSGLNLREAVHNGQQLVQDILILEGFLSSKKQHQDRIVAREVALELRHFLAAAILPPDTFAERHPYAIESKAELAPDVIAKYHVLSYRGLLCLSHLQTFVPLSIDEDLVAICTCLASFSSPTDPWTCEAAFEESLKLLERLRTSLKGAELADLLAQLLRERIKPAFAKTKNSKLTQQGRKAIDPLQNSAVMIDEGPDSKPWKYCDVYIPTVLRWILDSLRFVDPKFVENYWPLIIPPMLALIDDSCIRYKAAGCFNLSVFLQACPSTVLERTGIGEVFENAIIPCLMYLPTLTDEADSILLLDQAYRALIKLACVRFTENGQRTQKVKALDNIMRYGVLKGYAHAGEHAKIATILVKQIIEMTKEMGIDFVKHLKHVLAILSAIMANPFGTAYPPLLAISVKALQNIITTVWPRVEYHRGEILKALTVCWLRIEDDGNDSTVLEEIRRDIEDTTQMLTALLSRSLDVADECHLLVESDCRLQALVER